MFRIVSTTCESSRELQGSRASTGIASADIVMRGLHKLRPRHLIGDERQEVVEPLRCLPVSRFAPVQVSGVAERKSAALSSLPVHQRLLNPVIHGILRHSQSAIVYCVPPASMAY